MPPPGDGTALNTITKPGGQVIRYLRIRSGPQRGRYVHQMIAEAMLGRALRADEEVDHKDQDTLNNDWRNLEVLTVEAHAKTTRARVAQAVAQAEGEAALAEDRATRRLEEVEGRDAVDGGTD